MFLAETNQCKKLKKSTNQNIYVLNCACNVMVYTSLYDVVQA
jgi:hypothetical protein